MRVGALVGMIEVSGIGGAWHSRGGCEGHGAALAMGAGRCLIGSADQLSCSPSTCCPAPSSAGA